MARKAKAVTRGFARDVIAWQRKHGRHDLPWQRSRDPYAIWVSEIMLQQTQVATVIPYFERFLERFPDVAALASADEDAVLALWSGLGYYSRARNLLRAARLVMERYGGRFPRTAPKLETLPGIGRSTAAAIAVFSAGERRSILDGNVKRVLARCFGIAGHGGEGTVLKRLWELADSLLPERDIGRYTQGLMDLGATVCLRNRPRCECCPVAAACVGLKKGRVAELPSPRPRRPGLQRETVMLLLLRGGEILLEKRPSSGVWGGLWSLPEAAPGEDLRELCRHRYGAEIAVSEELPALDHAFTHFRLRIHPRRARARPAHPAVQEPGTMWVNVDDALGAALPAPVRRLIRAHARRDA